MILIKSVDSDLVRMIILQSRFQPSELVARVKAHLARYERLIGSRVQKNDIIEIRGIKIDKTARRVWVNEEEKAVYYQRI